MEKVERQECGVGSGVWGVGCEEWGVESEGNDLTFPFARIERRKAIHILTIQSSTAVFYLCNVNFKGLLSRPFAALVVRRMYAEQKNAVWHQEQILKDLCFRAGLTVFGQEHDLMGVKSHADLVKRVPVRDYEGLRPWFDRVKNGEPDILWPGKPLYLAKTSGTTSGAKYIPITQASMPNHITSARNALLSYIHETGKTGFIAGKMIFLQGSPVLQEMHGIQMGRLSGLVYHHVPNYLLRNRLPSYEINCIEDWEEKVEAIARETIKENMSLISGIPPWVIMYFEKLRELSGKEAVKDIFPNFSLFVYGGVNYEPYRHKMEELMGKRIDSVETYPASEGFIAFQDSQKEPGLLLNVNSGIYFEFIPVSEYHNEHPKRLSLAEVDTETNYALVLHTNAGLWGYSIGDTVRFVSLNPYRIVVTGRIRHFISAFGEHVIGEEVEYAMQQAAAVAGVRVSEFTVAPQVDPAEGLPYHEWLVEFDVPPSDMAQFAADLDRHLQEKNIYYKDLITGAVLRPLVITPIENGGFREYMKSQGKLGGQNKVPRLSNDRKIADELIRWRSR